MAEQILAMRRQRKGVHAAKRGAMARKGLVNSRVVDTTPKKGHFVAHKLRCAHQKSPAKEPCDTRKRPADRRMHTSATTLPRTSPSRCTPPRSRRNLTRAPRCSPRHSPPLPTAPGARFTSPSWRRSPGLLALPSRRRRSRYANGYARRALFTAL